MNYDNEEKKEPSIPSRGRPKKRDTGLKNQEFLNSYVRVNSETKNSTSNVLNYETEFNKVINPINYIENKKNATPYWNNHNAVLFTDSVNNLNNNYGYEFTEINNSPSKSPDINFVSNIKQQQQFMHKQMVHEPNKRKNQAQRYQEGFNGKFKIDKEDSSISSDEKRSSEVVETDLPGDWFKSQLDFINQETKEINWSKLNNSNNCIVTHVNGYEPVKSKEQKNEPYLIVEEGDNNGEKEEEIKIFDDSNLEELPEITNKSYLNKQKEIMDRVKKNDELYASLGIEKKEEETVMCTRMPFPWVKEIIDQCTDNEDEIKKNNLNVNNKNIHENSETGTLEIAFNSLHRFDKDQNVNNKAHYENIPAKNITGNVNCYYNKPRDVNILNNIRIEDRKNHNFVQNNRTNSNFENNRYCINDGNILDEKSEKGILNKNSKSIVYENSKHNINSEYRDDRRYEVSAQYKKNNDQKYFENNILNKINNAVNNLNKPIQHNNEMNNVKCSMEGDLNVNKKTLNFNEMYNQDAKENKNLMSEPDTLNSYNYTDKLFLNKDVDEQKNMINIEKRNNDNMYKSNSENNQQGKDIKERQGHVGNTEMSLNNINNTRSINSSPLRESMSNNSFNSGQSYNNFNQQKSNSLNKDQNQFTGAVRMDFKEDNKRISDQNIRKNNFIEGLVTTDVSNGHTQTNYTSVYEQNINMMRNKPLNITNNCINNNVTTQQFPHHNIMIQNRLHANQNFQSNIHYNKKTNEHISLYNNRQITDNKSQEKNFYADPNRLNPGFTHPANQHNASRKNEPNSSFYESKRFKPLENTQYPRSPNYENKQDLLQKNNQVGVGLSIQNTPNRQIQNAQKINVNRQNFINNAGMNEYQQSNLNKNYNVHNYQHNIIKPQTGVIPQNPQNQLNVHHTQTNIHQQNIQSAINIPTQLNLQQHSNITHLNKPNVHQQNINNQMRFDNRFKTFQNGYPYHPQNNYGNPRKDGYPNYINENLKDYNVNMGMKEQTNNNIIHTNVNSNLLHNNYIRQPVNPMNVTRNEPHYQRQNISYPNYNNTSQINPNYNNPAVPEQGQYIPIHAPQAPNAFDFGFQSPKVCLGIDRKIFPKTDKTFNHTILPKLLHPGNLLESIEFKLEFLETACKFMESIYRLDFNNITVAQLKDIIKRFGLNHQGKKINLIGELTNTRNAILQKINWRVSDEFMKAVIHGDSKKACYLLKNSIENDDKNENQPFHDSPIQERNNYNIYNHDRSELKNNVNAPYPNNDCRVVKRQEMRNDSKYHNIMGGANKNFNRGYISKPNNINDVNRMSKDGYKKQTDSLQLTNINPELPTIDFDDHAFINNNDESQNQSQNQNMDDIFNIDGDDGNRKNNSEKERKYKEFNDGNGFDNYFF